MNKKLFILILIFFLFFSLNLSQAQPLESQVQISVSAIVGGGELPSSPSAPPWAPSPPAPAMVIFEGKAYPDAFLTVLRNKEIAATFFADSSGLFKKELTGMKAGTYTFGIWTEDKIGRKSVTLNFTVSILEGIATTISGIFMPPTIQVLPAEVERGDNVDISGQSFPESEIKIFIDPGANVKEAKANKQGKWIYKLNTIFLPEEKYIVRTKAFYGEGEFSPFSQVVNFLVSGPVCWGADLNFDKWVNTIDFSILLYFWKETRPTNICADINFDSIVNVIDFSIMMHEWTG